MEKPLILYSNVPAFKECMADQFQIVISGSDIHSKVKRFLGLELVKPLKLHVIIMNSQPTVVAQPVRARIAIYSVSVVDLGGLGGCIPSPCNLKECKMLI